MIGILSPFSLILAFASLSFSVDQDLLSGEWNRLGDNLHCNSEVTFFVTDEGYVSFSLKTNCGAHIGEVEGYAVDGDEWLIFSDSSSEAEIRFSFAGDTMIVEQNEASYIYCGSGVSFEGKYLKGPKREVNFSLAEQGILLNPYQEDILKQLVGDYYDYLLYCFHIVEDLVDIDDLGAKVTGGRVMGLALAMEAIIMANPENILWLAFVDSEQEPPVIRYYTNCPSFADTIPQTIEHWVQKFPDYEVIFQ